MSTPPAITISDLHVRRGQRLVLPGVSLRIASGVITGLLGPSGCGKSTLIRAIAGVQEVESGTVEVLGLPAGSPQLRHRVAYVTQSPSIYDDLTVRDNVRYFASLYGRDTRAADEALATVDLSDHASALGRNLSGGQRSRLSLASAMVSGAEMYLLDEPTVGLDPVLRRSLWDLFHRLADGGATLLVSSHVMDEATRCDHLLLMRQGRFLADASLPELLAHTGAPDAEAAFLSLIDAANEEPA